MSKAVQVSPLPAIIDELWERRTELSPADEQARAAVVGAVDAIDAGQARVAVVDPATDKVVVDERAKRAILPPSGSCLWPGPRWVTSATTNGSR